MGAGPTRSDDFIEDSLPTKPRANLWTWYHAWREVVRTPDKTMPEPHLPPEGEPIPAAYDLHCPECGAPIGGLREWICPRCHERFSPRRAYTLRMLRDPEYFLRYRFSPRDLRTVIYTVVMLVAGTIMALIAGSQYVVTLSMVSTVSAPLQLSVKTVAWVAGMAAPCLVLIKFVREMPWFRVAFYYSIIWFLAAAAIVVIRLL